MGCKQGARKQNVSYGAGTYILRGDQKSVDTSPRTLPNSPPYSTDREGGMLHVEMIQKV